MSPNYDIANVSAEDDLKAGALADGLATSAVNSTQVDDGSTGLVGVANTNNSNNTSTNTTDTSVDVKNNGDNRDNTNNGDNRGNSSDQNHDNQVTTNIKDNGDNRDNSYNYDYKAITKTDTNVHTEANNNGDNRDNYSYSDSSTHSNYNFGTISDVHDVGNLGVAGHDLTFNLGDDYSFNLNIDGVLNNALGGGNDTGFSLVQANNLADQDQAYNVGMQNQGASINLTAEGGHSHADGLALDPTFNWIGVPSVGHDMTGTATSDSTAIISNSGFHQEVVQGANLLTNTADIAVGGDHHVTTSGHS
ncbi:fibrinogen-binding protein [Rhizobium calliandrae]|uniref:Fibrinogen-binding protein n=1 Tax=Rhizobium calliandrae TaxID=1312182 RepID=A0ABT7KHE0_9HYPH|nr:fibrinogen-binding protein [Rhizobium calliandrae]MDL2407358.1 fibrinogen-binding protein [Rhizobium calliandrae]